MKILVTGAGGMLAHSLVPLLRARGHEVSALSRAELDVTDRDAVEAAVAEWRPEAVVQCAAYTAVDAAETHDAEATRINGTAAGIVAASCHTVGALFVYPSTDYVFSGAATRPYRPEDPPAPLNAYGRSKLAGERAALAATDRALVVRTSWLYGPGGRNFVDTIAAAAREQPGLDVVEDQLGRPTSCIHLADCIAGLLEAGAVGTFHATGGGEAVSWYGFAREILSRLDLVTPVRPTRSGVRPALRPAYSVLDCADAEEVLGRSMPDWRQSLSEYLAHRVEAEVSSVRARSRA